MICSACVDSPPRTLTLTHRSVTHRSHFGSRVVKGMVFLEEGCSRSAALAAHRLHARPRFVLPPQERAELVPFDRMPWEAPAQFWTPRGETGGTCDLEGGEAFTGPLLTIAEAAALGVRPHTLASADSDAGEAAVAAKVTQLRVLAAGGFDSTPTIVYDVYDAAGEYDWSWELFAGVWWHPSSSSPVIAERMFLDARTLHSSFLKLRGWGGAAVEVREYMKQAVEMVDSWFQAEISLLVAADRRYAPRGAPMEEDAASSSSASTSSFSLPRDVVRLLPPPPRAGRRASLYVPLREYPGSRSSCNFGLPYEVEMILAALASRLEKLVKHQRRGDWLFYPKATHLADADADITPARRGSVQQAFRFHISWNSPAKPDQRW